MADEAIACTDPDPTDMPINRTYSVRGCFQKASASFSASGAVRLDLGSRSRARCIGQKLVDLAFVHQSARRLLAGATRRTAANLPQPRFRGLLVRCGPLELPVQAARRNSTFFAFHVFPLSTNSGMIPVTERKKVMALLKAVCPHCYRESANSLVCTSLGCGKRIAVPVRLSSRARTKSVSRKHRAARVGLSPKRRTAR